MYIGKNLNAVGAEQLKASIGSQLTEALIAKRDVSPIADWLDLLEIQGFTVEHAVTLEKSGFHFGPSLDAAPGLPALVELPVLPTSQSAFDGALRTGQLGKLLIAAGGLLFQQRADDDDDDANGDDDASKPTIPDTRYIRQTWKEDHHGQLSIPCYQTLTGYCTIVWILTNGAGGAVGNGGSPHGAGSGAVAGAPGAAGLRTPTQAAVNGITADIRAANGIFQACDFSLRLCQVHVLDSTVAQTANGQQTLARVLFNGAGTLFGDPGNGGDSALQVLFDALGAHFNAQFDRRCVHLFYTRDVQESPQRPDQPGGKAVVGVGADMRPPGRVRNPRFTPMGIVEGGGTTVAHETAHGMGHSEHAAQSRDRRVRADRQNLMKETNGGTSLQASQCQRLQRFAAQYLRVGCP